MDKVWTKVRWKGVSRMKIDKDWRSLGDSSHHLSLLSQVIEFTSNHREKSCFYNTEINGNLRIEKIGRVGKRCGVTNLDGLPDRPSNFHHLIASQI